MLISFLFISYLSFYFLRLHEYSPETAQTNILAILLGTCVILYLFKPEKNLKVVQVPYITGFFVWSLLSHISFGYLAGLIVTAEELIRLLILYFIASALFVDIKRVNLYLKFICLCAFIMALHGIDQFHSGGIGWTGMILSQGTRIRYIGVFGDPNDLGMLFLIAIPIYLYFLSKSKFILSQILWLISTVVLLYAIYLTNSRGTLVGLFALLGFYGWHKYSRTLITVVIVALLPIAFAATRLSTISSSEASQRQRLDSWTEGFYMLRSDPLFGVGHGLFRDYHYQVAHSSYVHTFAEIGLIGYFFWLGFLSMSIYALYVFIYKYPAIENDKNTGIDLNLSELKALASTIMYSLLAFAVCGFFISRGTQPILFLLCGMSAGIIAQINKQYSDAKILTFTNTFKPTVYLTIGSVIIIYFIVRVAW